MSHKLQRILIRTVNRLTRKDVSNSKTCFMKQNFCCSNVSWGGSKFFHYESRSLCGTSAVANSKNETENNNTILVYYGLLTAKIKTLKVVSYTTSMIGLMAQPVIYDKIMSMGAPAIIILYSVMGFSTFVSPLLIHFVTKKYITEIKYDPSLDVYISKTLTFFLQDKVVRFKPEEVQFNPTSRLFNVLTIKGKPYMIFEEGILVKDHYIKLLGFDKPIDLKLNDESVGYESSNIKTVYEK